MRYLENSGLNSALLVNSLYYKRLREAIEADQENQASEFRHLCKLPWARRVFPDYNGGELIAYLAVGPDDGTGEERWEIATEIESVGTPHNLPRSGVIEFRGRAEQLSELHEKLARAKPTAILAAVAGMGGVGKTELALQYAISRKDKYPGGICWLEGENPETGLLNYAARKLEINVPEYLDLDIDGRLDHVLSKWPARPTLLILDDVSLPLPGFLERVDSQTDDANPLCEWLGDLPLGIELVGAYLRKREDLSLAELLERLKEKSLHHRATQKDPKEAMTAKQGVFAALDLSREKLEPGALDLAMLLGQLGQAPIPLRLIEAISARYTGDSYDKEVWEDARAELVGFHLLERPEEGVYRLHPLVREYLQEYLAEIDNKRANKIRQTVVDCLVREARQVGQALTLSEAEAIADLLPHWEWDLLGEDDLIRPFVALAWYYTLYSDFDRVFIYYKRCLEVSETQLGPEHPDTAPSLNNLAALYDSQGKFDEALPLYERTLLIFDTVLGANIRIR